MLSKHVSIVTEEDYWNASQTYKYTHRRGFIRMHSILISILTEDDYSNAFQTYKYSHRRVLFECFQNL